MGMVRIEVLRPKRPGLKVTSDEDLQKDFFSVNTRSILLVREAGTVSSDYASAKSAFVLPIGEFQSTEKWTELAARIHRSEVSGNFLRVCQRCGSEVLGAANEATRADGFCDECSTKGSVAS